MHYDDSERRLNLLSGILVGAFLGAGLVLLLSPTDRAVARRSRVLARAGRRLGRGRREAGERDEAPAPRRKFEL